MLVYGMLCNKNAVWIVWMKDWTELAAAEMRDNICVEERFLFLPSLCLPAPAAAVGPGVMSFLVRQLEKNCHRGIYNHWVGRHDWKLKQSERRTLQVLAQVIDSYSLCGWTALGVQLIKS